MEQYSKVGHTEKMFGQQFNFVTTNASASDMLGFDQNGEQAFISSSLIVASPTNDDGIDNGTPSLIVTDYEGHPMRLTYTIKPGNGLTLGYTYSNASGIIRKNSLDTLSFEIDNDSLKCHELGFVYVSGSGIIEGSKYLEASGKNDIDVNINSLTDNYRIKVYDSNDHKRLAIDAQTLIDNDSLKVNTSGSSSLSNGFADQYISVDLKNIIDGSSLNVISQENKDVLGVNTYSLAVSTPSTVGVTKFDGSTIKMNNNLQLYVDVNQLRLAPSSGGKGLLKVQRKGVGDLFVDDTGYLRVDPKNMPKCSTIDSTKENRGFGVCAVDGTTIKASQNGVLSVISSGLSNATASQNGIVRPDNSTISIQPSGIIAVNTEKLTKGSAAEYGTVKYDNKTITKNAQGQLTVTNATKWSTDISNLAIMLNGYAKQIANLEAKLNDFMGTLNAKTTAQFKVMSDTKDLSIISVTIPNITGRNTGTTDWDTENIGKSFTIVYGEGYIFRYEIVSTNLSNWLVSSKLKINGVSYAPGTDIKLTSSSGTKASFIFSIQGYGMLKTQRPEGVFNIVFSDANGQPLKTITLYINNPITVREVGGFALTFNKDNSNAFTNTTSIKNATLDKAINSVMPQKNVIGVKTQFNSNNLH